MHRQRVVGPISKAIITFVEKREAQLLNNDILLAAVFVDAPNLVLLPPPIPGVLNLFLPFAPSQLPNIKLSHVFCLLTSTVEKCTTVEKINTTYQNICLKV